MAARTRRSLMRRAIIVSAIMVVAILVAALITHVGRLRERALPSILRVGIDPGFPPFAWLDGGALYGIDPSLAQALGDQLGLPVETMLLGFDGVYDALAADRVNIVLAALPIDPARRDRVHYTPPYFNAGLVLVSDARRPLAGMEALAGGRLAFEYGSTAQTEAGRWLRHIAPFELRPYEFASVALDAVRVDDADGALVDSVSARLYRQQQLAWGSSTVPITVVPLAAVLRADRPELASAADEAMHTLMNEGTLERLIEAAFERYAAQLPSQP